MKTTIGVISAIFMFLLCQIALDVLRITPELWIWPFLNHFSSYVPSFLKIAVRYWFAPAIIVLSIMLVNSQLRLFGYKKSQKDFRYMDFPYDWFRFKLFTEYPRRALEKEDLIRFVLVCNSDLLNLRVGEDVLFCPHCGKNAHKSELDKGKLEAFSAFRKHLQKQLNI